MEKNKHACVSLQVGETVMFNGGNVYISSNASCPAKQGCSAAVKITQFYNGMHPYHVISTDGQGSVYGWVDAACLSEILPPPCPPQFCCPPPPCPPQFSCPPPCPPQFSCPPPPCPPQFNCPPSPECPPDPCCCKCCANWVPPVIGFNGNWWINCIDTGIPAKVPSIGCNRHWYIGDTDTGLLILLPIPVEGPP